MQRGAGCQSFDPVDAEPKPPIGAAELLGTTSWADPEFHAAIMLEPASAAEDVSVTFFGAVAVSSDNDGARNGIRVEDELTSSPWLAGCSAPIW